MASADVYDAIRAHLEANWATTALVFENESYDPPAGSHWCLVEMSGEYYGRESIGADNAFLDRWEERGEVMISCFSPANSGARTARAHLATLADLFRGQVLMSNKLEFYDAKVGFGENVSLDQGSDGNWYRLIMMIDWRVIDR